MGSLFYSSKHQYECKYFSTVSGMYRKQTGGHYFKDYTSEDI